MNETKLPQSPVSGQRAFVLAVVGATALVAAGGAVYGRISQRWGPPPRLAEAGAQLATLPDVFGDWKLQEELPMDEGAKRMLECTGSLNRRYVNRQTGDEVTMAMIVGPAGPTAVHTPEICYSSQAYNQLDDRRLEVVVDDKGVHQSFWRVSFEPRNSSAEQLHVYYAWRDDEQWRASQSPRFEFAAAPLLYKIQVAALGSASDKADDDAGKQFLEDLLNSGWKPSDE